jgi:hypothetical protein
MQKILHLELDKKTGGIIHASCWCCCGLSGSCISEKKGISRDKHMLLKKAASSVFIYGIWQLPPPREVLTSSIISKMVDAVK